MRRQLLLLLSLLIVSVWLAGSAGAQAAPTATGPGGYLVLGVGASAYHIEYGQRVLGGVQGWVDFKPIPRLSLEGEARLLNRNEDLHTHAATFLLGPRFSRQRRGVEPYVKALAGSGHFVFPYNYARGNYFVVSGGGGVDLHVGNRLRVRALDVEYQYWPKFSFGTMNSYGISAGISYTFYHSETRWIR